MLEFNNISVQKNKTEILKDVSFSLKPHTITVLLGKNGAGKSTLLSCLTGETKYKGKIFFSDKDLSLLSYKERGKLISLLPQSLPVSNLRGKTVVEMGRNPYLDLRGVLTEKDRERVSFAVKSMNSEALLEKRLCEMSGGERQKIFISMILSQNSRVMAFDEPTTYLDPQKKRSTGELLLKLKNEEKKTVLVSLHDLDLAFEIADNVAVLDEGELLFFGSKEDCLQKGIIEDTFSVRRFSYFSEGEEKFIFK